MSESRFWQAPHRIQYVWHTTLAHSVPLIVIGYYLTLHPSTRPASLSPGTPERPLSDLGLKGYTAYWVSVVLRLLRRLLVSAPPIKSSQATPLKSPAQSEGRSLRQRPVSTVGEQIGMTEHANGVAIRMMSIPSFKGQYAIALSLSDIARACHLRPDDTAFTLTELGFLQHRRPITSQPQKRKRRDDANGEGDAEQGSEAGGGQETDLGEWKGVEVVITREAVEEMWVKWRVRDKAVLEEEYVLL
jgi:histone acetyltransferase MYST1